MHKEFGSTLFLPGSEPNYTMLQLTYFFPLDCEKQEESKDDLLENLQISVTSFFLTFHY